MLEIRTSWIRVEIVAATSTCSVQSYYFIYLSIYPSIFLIHPPIHRTIYPSIFHFSSVTPATGFQSHLITFTCLLLLRILESSASSLFHSLFSPHLGFPSTFFSPFGDQINSRWGYLYLPCPISVHIILTFYIPFFPELFVLLSFFMITLFLILLFWMFFLLFSKNHFLY